MRSLMRKAGLMFVGGLAVALLAADPSVASAKPRPGAKPGGFRLFARTLGAITGNRIFCGLNAAKGHVCVDSLGSSTIGGGFWPKGTIDQYVFNSGIQVVGVVSPSNPANPWAGDTAGGFFFDPKGTTENGAGVFPIYNTASPQDVAVWPEAAFVPAPPDPQADLFSPALHGNVKASDNDVWFMSWEGDPASNAGRTHPLGIAVETRGMAFNTPTGNEDILYFIYTFYNITTTDRAAYGSVRTPMVDTLLGLAKKFQAVNAARFGEQLPAAGYGIDNMYVVFGADMDVGDSNLDFASVNLPFDLGFTYQNDFGSPSGWVFDPGIFGDPFFPGVGFVGVKYLKSPVNPVTGLEVGLTLYSNTSRSVSFQDANDVFQLYRYASGNINPALGDDSCNTGNPLTTHICFINRISPADMRFFQSSGPLSIPPGGSGSVVVAYVFAAPVKTGSCPGPSTCSLTPDDPTRLSSVATLNTTGANRLDSVSGYAGFLGDLNANNAVDQEEIQTVPQSLLGKATIAQTVFDTKFLQPSPPDAPDFFLVPGNNQVTVLWRPSVTETNGDPYFAAASGATLYDPNYRQFDVEGYRIYRGRTGQPSQLELLAQFDYADRFFTDSTGQVNTVNPDRTTTCSPEVGVLITCDTLGTFNGVRLLAEAQTFPIASPFVQVPTGRVRVLADSTGFVELADTAVTSSRSAAALGVSDPALLQLTQSGVPFVFVDNTVRNGIRYFYAVAAFDVNSIRSGPSSLESARIAKQVTPQRTPGNQQLSGSLGTVAFTGRPTTPGGAPVVLDTTPAPPTIDPVTGMFSGPAPPANNWEFGLGTFVTAVLTQPGQVSVTLDSVQLGSAWDGLPTSYWYTATSGTLPPSTFSVPITQDATDVAGSNERNFPAIKADAALTARFDSTVATQSFTIPGRLAQGLVGNYFTSAYGRACINGAEGFADAAGCDYNGPRWFDGPSPTTNETVVDPNAGNGPNSGAPAVLTNYNNAGGLTGVAVIHHPLSYQTLENFWRQIEGALGGAQRAADFNVYWGAAGLVDSVIDITHNVAVPFAADHIGGTWGFLNQSATTGVGSRDARPGVLTLADFGCVTPLNTFGTVGGAGGLIACTAPAYQLSQTAVPGTIAHFSGSSANSATSAAAAGQGFAMYMPGNIFMFELPPAGTVPAQGTVWSLRTYIGGIQGGNGSAGNEGPYVFTPQPRTASAVGTSYTVDYQVTNQFVATADSTLQRVHPVPDPYYVTNAFEASTENKVIKFVNMPSDAILRIYSLSGVLVRVIEHHATGTSESVWDVRNRNGQVVSSGVYFYHIEAGGARRVGRMTVVNFAQ